MYDSIYDTLDSETINVIGNFFGDSVVNMVHTQKQTGCDDCGLFAIANAVNLAMKRKPTRVKFRQTLMRAHLIKCFETSRMKIFPCTSTSWIMTH